MPREPVYGPENEYSPGDEPLEDIEEEVAKLKMEEEQKREQEQAEWDARQDQPPPQPKPVKTEKRKLGTGEPILLYVEFSRGVYELYSQPFDSRIEAEQYAKTEYPGAKFKVLSESEAQAEAEKQERRQEKIEKVKETVVSGAKAAAGGFVDTAKRGAKVAGRGVTKVGKDVLTASRAKAKSEGLTREEFDSRQRDLIIKQRDYDIRQPKRTTERRTFSTIPPLGRHPKQQPPEKPRPQYGQQPRSQPFRPSPQKSGFTIRIPTGPYRGQGMKTAHHPDSHQKSQFRFNPFPGPYRGHQAGRPQRPPEQKPKPKKKKHKKMKVIK